MIVKLPSGRYLNLANMTDAAVSDLQGLSVKVYWNFPVGIDGETDGASSIYYGDDAEAIIDALDAQAEAMLRAAQ